MKKTLKRVVVLILMMVLSVNLLTIENVSADSHEYAWFPAPKMNLKQIAYESYSHSGRNCIDIAPGGTVFAPFTGKIVYKESKYNFVMLQSTNKVHYADGTLDYMTVGFMHDNNISDLKKGQVIAQGKGFYHAGTKGAGTGAHVQIAVFKGKVSSAKNYSKGNKYAFDAFYVNREKTTSIINQGKLEKGNHLTSGNYSNWAGLWKNLPSSGSSVTPPASSSSISVSRATKPSSIKQGSVFYCKGYVKSSYTLKDVTAGIYSTNLGKAYYKKSVNPNSTSYDLSGAIDKAMYFNRLGTGTYRYRVTATDSKNYTKTLIDANFSILGASTLKITGASTPGEIKYGKTWSCVGKITSNYTITNVTGSIIRSNGKNAYSKSVNPNSKSYSLKNTSIDYALYFNKLSKGTYTYRIIASDSSGKSVTLINKKFYVV